MRSEDWRRLSLVKDPQTHVLVFEEAVPPEFLLEESLADGFDLQTVPGLFQLKNISGPSIVLMYSDQIFAAQCPAVRLLTRLRTLRELDKDIRSLPVIIVGMYKSDFLLRQDPGFLVFFSPGVRYVSHSAAR